MAGLDLRPSVGRTGAAGDPPSAHGKPKVRVRRRTRRLRPDPPQRPRAAGSGLQGAGYAPTVEGLPEIALQHLYRTNGFLAEVRGELETELFARDRDLFSQELDVVFLDTTSVAVYREEETEWRKRGYSRDHRPDLPQLVLSVAVDRKGWPVSWEVFPGNTADPAAFEAMIAKLRTRFRIGRVVVVADRGMMGQKSLALLEEGRTPYDYILRCRMRKQKEIGTEVLARAGRYQEVAENLKVQEVPVDSKTSLTFVSFEKLQCKGSRLRLF